MPSLTSLFAPRLQLPSAVTHPALKLWTQQATDAVNALPNFSQFSFLSPNSNVTAQAPALGFNLAPASAASTLWFKREGSRNTGWIALA